MSNLYKFFTVCLGSLLLLSGARAQDISKLTEEDRQKLNTWRAERAERMVNAHRLNMVVGQAWANTKYTSPEIEELRQRLRQLQDEVARVQGQIQAKVLELPELKEQQSTLTKENDAVEELNKNIKKLAEKTQ